MNDSTGRPLEPIEAASESESGSAVRAVALDMDGLLFDTERIYWQVGDTLLQRRGHRFSVKLQARMMGRIGAASMQEMIDLHDLSDNATDLLEESDRIYGELLPKMLRPMPGLDTFVQKLRSSGLPFALTTSSRRKWVDVIFDGLDWWNDLAFSLTGDDVSRGKPHPEIYLKAAQGFAVAPQNLLVLEDSGNGCQSAIAAGAIAVAIPSEHTRHQDFSGAALIADSLLDERLWQMIDQMRG